MLHGPLLGKLIIFAVPLALSSIISQLFNSADAVVAGRFINSGALAAVGGVAPVISLLIGLFVGLSVGANVAIAIRIGHGRMDLREERGANDRRAHACMRRPAYRRWNAHYRTYPRRHRHARRGNRRGRVVLAHLFRGQRISSSRTISARLCCARKATPDARCTRSLPPCCSTWYST